MILISDLHLEPGRPDITATLLHLLATTARGEDRLYILGDLFEVWLGDDDDSTLADRIAVALAELSATGTRIFLLHGNRDFLLGPHYAARCGATMLEEPQVLDYHGHRYALLHGDILCTRDIGYQALRAQVRDPAWQQAFLARPLDERRAFARDVRARSQADTASKASEIMDVTPEAVAPLMAKLGVDTMIHGHTHRPAIHEVAGPRALPSGHPLRRVVLGDWDRQSWLVRITPAGLTLEHFPLLS